MTRTTGIWKGAVAGVIAGCTASWLMNRFQAAATKLKDRDQQEQNSQDGEDATMKAADALAKNVFRIDLSKEDKEQLGPVVHYVFGSSMGALFGVIADLYPSARAGWGMAFGTALFLVADELAVPLLHLSSSPKQTPLKTHLFAWASHLVYGAGTESVRRVVRGVMDKPAIRLSQTRASSHMQARIAA